MSSVNEKPSSATLGGDSTTSTTTQGHNAVQSTEPATEKTPAAEEPPNGGLLAWSQVLAAFFLFFNPWGLVNSFGVFQDYYESTIGRPPSDISWIGTFQGFLLFLVGILSGPVFDMGYYRELVVTGTFLIVFGMMMTSLATEYYQLFLAQGITVGLGMGCLFVPSVAIASQYFTTKRALAVGITATGGSIGGIIYPIIFRELEPRIGFGWTTRIIGFIALGTLLFSLAIIRPRGAKAARGRALLDLQAFKSTGFCIYIVAIFFNCVGLYFPFFYISSWAQTELGVASDSAFYLLCILNAGSFFGRLIPGLLADKIGSLNAILPCAFLASVTGFAWLGVRSYGELIVYAIFYGFFSGACISLPPTVIAGITPELSKIGTWMGMSFAFAGLGLLIGNPIAGAIIDSTGGNYVGAQCYSAATVMVGALLFTSLRFWRLKNGESWNMKV